MEKKRFILFGFNHSYPSGGLEDVIATFNKEEYAGMKKHEENWDKLQILDTETNTFYCSDEKNTLPQMGNCKTVCIDEDETKKDRIGFYEKNDDALRVHCYDIYVALEKIRKKSLEIIKEGKGSSMMGQYLVLGRSGAYGDRSEWCIVAGEKGIDNRANHYKNTGLTHMYVAKIVDNGDVEKFLDYSRTNEFISYSIDELLDKYNDCLELYNTFQDEEYLDKMEAIKLTIGLRNVKKKKGIPNNYFSI